MKTKKLVTTSMLLSLAVILSFVKISEFPFGGSITLASMMPIILISCLYDVKWGIGAAVVYGMIQILTGMSTVSAFFLPGESRMAIPAAVGVCFFDYVAAYGVLGFGGIFKHKFKSAVAEVVLGTVTALILKYVMHVISGTIFFSAWAEWFFDSGLSQIAVFKPFCEFVADNVNGRLLAVLYSVIYNGAYMIPETVITTTAVSVVCKIAVNSPQTRNNA